ncbi:SPOR domain-containing protein [Polaribacter sp. Hel_I_88]|uniref:SPOR domain-containing protein n=1 Tax=Polaribacter sp. Hel_I_88 TaxID=1250006 RepID=UPI00047E85E4|nr:SPOR domain-containing protein [Polaribacter sp. Hel_I_88]
MKNLAIVLFLSICLFSCKNKEVEKEDEKISEPEITSPVFEVEKDDMLKNADSESVKNDKVVFTVQIAALKNENEQLMNLNAVKTYQENSLTKYRLGSFETYQEAKQFRLQVLNTYKGAFVQALKNNEPIHISEALQE